MVIIIIIIISICSAPTAFHKSIDLYFCVLQITMTTVWLLLLLLVASSQSVDGQSTTDDETCGDGGLLSKMQTDMERILDNQQQIFQILQQYGLLNCKS